MDCKREVEELIQREYSPVTQEDKLGEHRVRYKEVYISTGLFAYVVVPRPMRLVCA
jgi:hypothetical protein